MTRILVCPTAFKGTLRAGAVADAMSAGARAAVPDIEIDALPLSDGGNGLLETLRVAQGGELRTARVAGPLGRPVEARFLVQGGRVVVETAEACGLHLVPPDRRDPLRTTTRGVGQLLLAARSAAPPATGPLVVGLGGSATVDAGAGMAVELGWRLLDEDGAPIDPTGSGLADLASIHPPEAPADLGEIIVLADVTNPLLGRYGAAPVFGPQKGASPAAVEMLARGLARWAEVVERDLGVYVAGRRSGGAAGGLGAAFRALLSASPVQGAPWILAALEFDRRLRSADLVVTGEGAWDAQSSMGKIAGEVVARSRAAGVPVLLVTGSVDGGTPEGARVAAGPGGMLDERAIAGLVEGALPGLLS